MHSLEPRGQGSLSFMVEIRVEGGCCSCWASKLWEFSTQLPVKIIILIEQVALSPGKRSESKMCKDCEVRTIGAAVYFFYCIEKNQDRKAQATQQTPLLSKKREAYPMFWFWATTLSWS